MPSNNPADTAVLTTFGGGGPSFATVYTVHRDGSAERSSPSGKVTATLSGSIVAKLFSDLQAAQPLSALPPTIAVDTSLTISWNRQQTPNIIAPLNGANAPELALYNDAIQVEAAFP